MTGSGRPYWLPCCINGGHQTVMAPSPDENLRRMPTQHALTIASVANSQRTAITDNPRRSFPIILNTISR